MKTVLVMAVAMTIAAASPAFAQLAAQNLVGAYIVTGTETNGAPYDGPGTVEISLAVSGALELKWEGGKYWGVGQVVGNALAVSSMAEGRQVIGIMYVNPDGSLTGKYWRRTDAGANGTETWRKR
jgi:hypothetical protein